MKTLWNIRLFNTGTGQEIYNENQSYYGYEPNNENVKDFIFFIRPSLKYDSIISNFVGNLDLKGNLINNE